MMSAKQDTSNTMMCCASCGKAEGDDTQLKKCDGCDLVKYCNDTCHENHQPEHEEVCKKRAAELRDEVLFRQPESNYLGDCPICLLPLPIIPGKSVYHACCCKSVCKGCIVANAFHSREQRLEVTCPFCRDTIETSDPSQHLMKRVQANDPIALRHMGTRRYDEGKYVEAFDYYIRAAKLGDARAHFRLSLMYRDGQGVEKDEKKQVYHAEEASIGGHPDARFNLARYETHNKDRKDRALKHLIICANFGHNESIKMLRVFYKDGLVSKDDFASALRAHKAAVDETKSPERDVAEEIEERSRVNG